MSKRNGNRITYRKANKGFVHHPHFKTAEDAATYLTIKGYRIERTRRDGRHVFAHPKTLERIMVTIREGKSNFPYGFRVMQRGIKSGT